MCIRDRENGKERVGRKELPQTKYYYTTVNNLITLVVINTVVN